VKRSSLERSNLDNILYGFQIKPKSTIIAFKMQISINNTLFARSAMIISKQQSADGTCPEDNRKLNRFEIESDEQCEQWFLSTLV
jgi:hypothetical protein